MEYQYERIMTVDRSAKQQQNIAYAKRIMLRILVYVLMRVTNIVRLDI